MGRTNRRTFPIPTTASLPPKFERSPSNESLTSLASLSTIPDRIVAGIREASPRTKRNGSIIVAVVTFLIFTMAIRSCMIPAEVTSWHKHHRTMQELDREQQQYQRQQEEHDLLEELEREQRRLERGREERARPQELRLPPGMGDAEEPRRPLAEAVERDRLPAWAAVPNDGLLSRNQRRVKQRREKRQLRSDRRAREARRKERTDARGVAPGGG